MTISLRKRNGSASSSDTSNSGSDADPKRYLDAFQRHFESRFAPLEKTSKEQHVPEESSEDMIDSEEQTDWDGIFSSDEESIAVVEHQSADITPRSSKAESRSFMTTKPPQEAKASSTREPPAAQKEKEDDETVNLKNDLALQRLISESHLLDQTEGKRASKNRQTIMDMRMQALGSKKSLRDQEKMPISHRRGIISKAYDRESRRRQHAKENGIILEKPVTSKSAAQKRLRGVGGPSVGKFRRGTLNLTKRDVNAITRPRSRA